jgi:hypothetical protein
MLNTYYGILVVSILFKLIFCEKNRYCVADGDSPGMFIEDFMNADSEYIGKYNNFNFIFTYYFIVDFIGQNSFYLDNSTEQLNLIQHNNAQHNSTWRIVDSVRDKTHLYVVDERWETFLDNHNNPRKHFIEIFNQSKLFFISVRITDFSSHFSSFKLKQVCLLYPFSINFYVWI